MRRRRRCAGPARFVFHYLIIVPSSCHNYCRWWNSLPSRNFPFFIFYFCLFTLVSIPHPSFTHLAEISYVYFLFFLSRSVPCMHAIYISRFSFSIAISRRHIIKLRLACNRRTDYGRPAALTITFVFSYFWFFLYTTRWPDFSFFLVPVSFTSQQVFVQVRFLFNTIPSFIFHCILTITPGFIQSPFGRLSLSYLFTLSFISQIIEVYPW
jgi:hypothetical protein